MLRCREDTHVMKVRTMLGLVFLVAVAVGFSYCAGYAHGRLVASKSVNEQTRVDSYAVPPPASAPPTTTAKSETTPRTNPTSAEPGPIISGMSKEAILHLLPSKTW